ncbi:S-layer homology domain-containing protein [Paenibacillus sp. HB172176]|uniref:S-layer homology domain-containing protein n=1 Tax=Paenibacillus sp. HB172176 TaxID=2493690 RepID=UPI001439A41D|nr:S-layer homology domain-containing protein [Paenibacillus sp. HB172176]
MNKKRWLPKALTLTLSLQLLTGLFGGAGTAIAATDSISAVGLPEGWSASKLYASDSLNPGDATVMYVNNRLSMDAPGGKMDSGGDSVAYAYMPIEGDKDFVFTARISDFDLTGSNSWASLMVKSGIDSDAKMVSLGLNAKSGIEVKDYRRLDSTGGGKVALDPPEGPVYVRIARTDNNLAFTYSTDGTNYVSRTNFDNNLNGHYTHLNLPSFYVGLAVSTGSAVFDHITFEVDGEEVFDSASLPIDDNPPGITDGLTAVARDQAVDLSWNTVTGATYYQVSGGTTDGGPYDLLLNHVDVTSATIDGLTNDTPYHFVVTAGNFNGLGEASAQVTATPTGLTVPGLYELGGFSAYNTGGGVLEENDPAYRKVYNATDLSAALQPDSGAKVIEIMNDLDLGWNEIPEAARTAPFGKHNEPLMHPVLLQTSATKITVSDANGLTIFSRNGSEIRHASLVFKASSNIIIRNLSFDELWEWDEATKGDYDRNDWDYISLENATSKVWIDHCTFGKAYDGVVDAKGGSNGITISWSRFLGDDGSEGSWVSQQIEAMNRLPDKYPMYQHLLDAGLDKSAIIAIASGQKKGHLIGSSEFASDNSQLELTLHHNYYKDMMNRIPRLRGGNAHVYNLVVDNAGAHAASKLITPEMALGIADAGYHFGVTSNGAISTEGGALLIEDSIINDVLYPLRNNQKADLDPTFTGKIKAINVRYSLDEAEYTGDSDTPDTIDWTNPLRPGPAEPIAFNWNTESGELPYLYQPDDLSGLEAALLGNASSGAGAGELYWDAANWLRTSDYTGSFASEPDSAPTVVSGLQANPADGSVALRWGNVAAASSYTLYRSESEEGSYAAIASELTAAHYTDAGLANGTTYYYKVSAVNAIGEGAISGAVSAVPFELAAPNAPSGLVSTSASTKIILDWDDGGADYYSVQRRIAGSSEFSVIAPRVFESTYEDKSAAAGTTYEYRVTAANDAGASEPTAAVSAKLVDLVSIDDLKLLAEDTFDSEETGGKPEEYTISEESGTLQIADVPGDGNKSLQFFDDRSGVVLADRSFESQTELAAVTFDFMQEEKANSVKVFRLSSEDAGGSTSNSYAAVAIETNGGNLAFRTSNGYTPFLTDYSAGTWYNIAVVANLASGKADVYVDGELALEQIGLFNAVPNIGLIQSFTANNNSANTYYLDNIRIYGKPDTDPDTGSGSGSGSGSNGSTVIQPPSFNTTTEGAEIPLTTASRTDSSGRISKSATLDENVLSNAAAALKGNQRVLTLAIEGDASDAEVKLPLPKLADILSSRETAGLEPLTLRFKTSLGRYELPLGSIDLDALVAELGDESDASGAGTTGAGATAAGTSAEDTPYLTIRMAQADEAQASMMEEAAQQANVKLLAPPVEFALLLTIGGQEHALNNLNGYASRFIPLPDGAAPGAGTTGAYFDEASGTFVGVPTIWAEASNGDDAAHGLVAYLLRTGNSSYALIEADASFADMTGHWARADVEELASMLLVNGVADEQFAPQQPVTRAEFAAMLTRSLGLAGGEASFLDVAEEDWFSATVGSAAKFGLVQGFEDGSFRPHDSITREQMAVMIDRALQWIADQAEQLPILSQASVVSPVSTANLLSRFADADQISGWASVAMASIVDAGILQGTPDGMLAPSAQATRAEAAAMLARMLRCIGFMPPQG